MLILRYLRVFLIILACGIATATNAETPIHVKLFQPENLDAQGRQIPSTPQVSKIFNYFERESGLKFDLIVLPWKRAQLEAMHGTGILYGFSKSAERLAQYRFSQPVITFQVWAISLLQTRAVLDVPER